MLTSMVCGPFADVIRRVAVRGLPHDFSLVDVDRRDGRVGRLDQRQSLDAQHLVRIRRVSASRGHDGRRFRFRHRRIGAGVFTGAARNLRCEAGDAHDVLHIGNRLGRFHQHDRREARVAGVGVDGMRFRIERRARPVGSAARGAESQSGERSVQIADHGRCEHRSDFVLADVPHRFGMEFGREVDDVGFGDAVACVGCGLHREGLRLRIPFARNGADFDWLFFHSENRLAGHAIEYIQEALFRRLRDGFYAACRRPRCPSAAAWRKCPCPTAGGGPIDNATCAAPVLRSTHTRLSPYRLLPGRWPP